MFDNRTALLTTTPRAVRYRIDQGRGTATLLQSISDPDVPVLLLRVRPAPPESGLADRLGSGDPPGDGLIGGYKPDGERTFLLTFRLHLQLSGTASPHGCVSAQDLRQGMNAMCSPGCR